MVFRRADTPRVSAQCEAPGQRAPPTTTRPRQQTSKMHPLHSESPYSAPPLSLRGPAGFLSSLFHAPPPPVLLLALILGRIFPLGARAVPPLSTRGSGGRVQSGLAPRSPRARGALRTAAAFLSPQPNQTNQRALSSAGSARSPQSCSRLQDRAAKTPNITNIFQVLFH